MRFMPSSLTSKSHRLLTALVDSKHKKVFKVKAVITETDPEKEKHEKEKVSLEVLLGQLQEIMHGEILLCVMVVKLVSQRKNSLLMMLPCFYCS